MSLNVRLQLWLQKANKVFEKISDFVSLKTCGYVGLAGFVGATVLSIASSSFLFSAGEDQPKKTSTTNQALSLNQSASMSDAEMKKILARNLFNKEGELGDELPVENEKKEITDEIIKSTLPLKLLGTIYGGDPFSGIALVEDTNKKVTNSFMVGEYLSEGVKVEQILKEKVIFSRSGQLEYIELEKQELVRRKRGNKDESDTQAGDDAPLAKMASSGRLKKFKEEGFEHQSGKINMTDEYKRNLLSNDFTKVLQDAKAEPNMVDGMLKGFKLMRIRSPSIYEKAGLVNGDIITEINGIELSSIPQAISTLKSLKSSSQMEITVLQDGVRNIIEINVGQ